MSSAVEAAQQVKYTHQENDLVYRVMVQENMKKLSLDVGDNEWYTVANVYKSTATSLQNSLKKMKEERIPTIIWLTPILLFINDTEENLRGILEYCVAVGVKGIVNFGMGVTLREENREYFYHALDQVFPGLSEEYRNKYGSAYIINSPNNKHLMHIFREICLKAGMMCQTDQIFSYLNLKEFPEKSEYQQISMFDNK